MPQGSAAFAQGLSKAASIKQATDAPSGNLPAHLLSKTTHQLRLQPLLFAFQL